MKGLKALKRSFEMKDLGPLKYFLGVEARLAQQRYGYIPTKICIFFLV